SDQCSVSRAVLTLREDGVWRLDLRADQNPFGPVTPAVDLRGLPDVRLRQVQHIRRNLFAVRLRGLGAFTDPLPAAGGPPVLARPVLLALPVMSFWVQNGAPYPFNAVG